MCLQGSSRKGQQFGVTASGTCIDSHQQTKCTQFNLDGLPCLQFLIACSMGSKTGGREDLGMRLNCIDQSYIAVFDIVLQAGSTSAKREGSSELFIQAMSCTLLSEVQSHCSILSRDTLHHCLSSNDSLENSVHATAGAAKNTSREACTFHSRYSVFQECIT